MHGVARCFGLREDVAHGLLDVNVLPGLRSELQKRRVGMVWGGNNYGVDVFQSQKLFGGGESARGAAVLLGAGSTRGFAIDGPEIADGGQFDVVVLFQLGGDFGEIAAAAADAYMAEGDTVVGADNAGIRQRGVAERGSCSE